MEKEKHPKHEFDHLIGVLSVLLIVFVFFLALRNDTSVFLVLYAFLPTVAYIIINYALLYELKIKRTLVWILPLILVLIFHAASEISGFKIMAGMDMNVVSYLNLLVSYIMAAVIMFYIFVRKELKHDEVKIERLEKKISIMEATEAKLQIDLREVNIRTTIQSIEDKCKAINFAIGRVYSNKHGGTAELREKIRISKEWYNKFSDLTEEFTAEHKEMVRLSVSLILGRLLLLDKKQKDILGNTSFKNINYKSEDSILKVLIANDKDPVETYVESAREFCRHVLAFISKP